MAKLENVNYYGRYRKITEEDKLKGIEIRWGGHYACGPQYTIDRVHPRYMLGYIEKGTCLHGGGSDDNITELHAGDLFFYKPHDKQYIKSIDEDPITYYGTCFSGEFMDAFIERTTLLNISVANLGVDPDILNEFNGLIEDFMLGQDTWYLFGSLMRLVSRISKKCVPDDSVTAGMRKNPEIVKAAEYIRLNYEKKISVDDLSLMTGYSASRFQYLFRQIYDVSVIEFLINERIKHAKELLRFDMLNINEVARSVGYEDSYYFSKIFKKREGVSPKEFRKNCTCRKI